MARAATRKSDTAARARAMAWTCVLGNNLADGDFLIAKALGGGKLEYLLQHRGYTHTIACAPLIALVAATLGAQFGRVRLKDEPSLLVMGFLSALAHIGADFWNDYGIHPFWPILNRWFYGDFVFILEPLIWLSLIPLVFFEARNLLLRWGALVLGVGIAATAWTSGYVPWPVAGWITLYGCVVYFAQRKIGGARLAFAAVGLVLAVFAIGSVTAKGRVRALFAEQVPAERISQLAISPAPGNPFCWKLTVSSDDLAKDAYFSRTGAVSLWPSLFDSKKCNSRLAVEIQDPLTAPELRSNDSVSILGEFRGKLSDLNELSAQHCRFEAMLRFARAPFWARTSSGGWYGGDLRYVGRGFAETGMDPSQACPPAEPPWTPPFQPK
jgi:inner membrane protein